MLTGFLDRIGSLFDKGLMLAALFPLLILSFILSTAAAIIFGIRSTFAWLYSLSTGGGLTLTAVATLLLLVTAFTLRGLRRPILDLWSGSGAPDWLIERQSKQRKALDDQIHGLKVWEDALEQLDKMQYEKRP